MISAYYRNPASIQRQKTRSSPRRQPHGYNTFDVTKSSVMDRQQEEESSFKQLYEKYFSVACIEILFNIWACAKS